MRRSRSSTSGRFLVASNYSSHHCLEAFSQTRYVSSAASSATVTAAHPMATGEKEGIVHIGRESSRKRRVVVLGSGWAGFRIAKNLNKEMLDVVVVSPRNHFLFTPLLASTTVGTLEFRAIIEPTRNLPGIQFFQANADSIDLENKAILCESVFDKDIDSEKDDSRFSEKAINKPQFWLDYDDLVIAVGGLSQTFGIKGVTEYAHFLKELHQARSIRRRLLQCFERASEPLATEEERHKLLHFVIVGGGPTGVEFAAELYDFLEQDVRKDFPDVNKYVKVTLVEASNSLLTSFDATLGSYAQKILKTHNVEVFTGVAVKEIEKGVITLSTGQKIDFGMCVWSTGIAANAFSRKASFAKERSGRLLTDEYLNVLLAKEGNPTTQQPSQQVTGQSGGVSASAPVYVPVPNVYAIGDCAVSLKNPLPATAQVANQKGRHLAKQLNRLAENKAAQPFEYHSRGMLAYVGGYKAVNDLPWFKGTGFGAWLFWRSAYLTNLVSISNKILVVMHWIKTFFFGRDVSQF